MSDDLHEIASHAGLAREFRDVHGRTVETPAHVIEAVLPNLGFDIATASSRRDTLAGFAEREKRLLAPTVTASVENASQADVLVPVGAAAGDVEWTLVLEDGTSRAGRDTCHGGSLALAGVPVGYHRLTLRSGQRQDEAWLIAAPPSGFIPADLEAGARGFGLTAQVYGLRSAGNFGIGDLGDVASLGEGAGRFGAAFLGLSPLHALFPSDRSKISPYSPSSRLFIDPTFIDPRQLPDFPASTAARFLAEAGNADEMERLRASEFVEQAESWALKRAVLEKYYARVAFGDDAAFNRFRAECGELLEQHALFEALTEHFAGEGKSWVGEWPEAYRSAQSEAVRTFRQERAGRVSFHAWLQYVADSQLAAAQQRALGAGMSIGLYRDLAVGVDQGGGELWARPDWFVPNVAVGAPPDLLGPEGQNWGLPPFNPRTLEDQGLQAFRTLVAANMRHAGAIRIDHAFQLQRLYVIPNGLPAKEGVYLHYPLEAMLAVLRIESHRARALVIAEDLGTSPVGFSDAIMASNILSYRILNFERDNGRFKPPSAYPRKALAAVATHDLPTFAGWWIGRDIDVRSRAAADRPAEQTDNERRERANDLVAFSQALATEGLSRTEAVSAEPPRDEAFRYLARTPSMLVALQLEDILGSPDQANMPGPDFGHPNWRRKLPTTVDRILAPGGALARTSAIMREEERTAKGAAAAPVSRVPIATYRLQFHKDFTFADAIEALPYIAKLGVSHIYASPILKARPGSTHGYDTVDPTQINPELGGLEGFERFAAAVSAHGLALLLDIVPNHMGVGGADNPWWLSLLEWGELSPFADTFDVDWERLGAHGKLVAPNLGAQYGETLEKGDLKLKFDADAGSFSVWFFEHRFPICPLNYPDIIDRAVAVDASGTDLGMDGLLRIGEELRAVASLPPERRGDVVALGERIKKRLAALAKQPGVLSAIEGAVGVVNGTPGLPESFGTLHRLLERQSYRLSFWRVASSDVNYRRFFDIDSLAGVRIEHAAVFERAHQLVFDLVRRGLVQGLRIDHIDGLADPAAYVTALQETIGPDFYIVAEKILEPGEQLRPWALAGTTGYEMLNLIDGVFVDEENEKTFDRLYRETAGFNQSYEDALLAAKRQVLLESFSSELESLVSDMKRIADANRLTRDYSVNAIRLALSDFICAFPVYRTYITRTLVEGADRALIDDVLAKAKEITALPDRSVHDFIASVLLQTIPTGRAGRAPLALLDRFRRRFQQLTGPVMAKSLEDTLFYRFVRFIALNEVGGEPSRFGIPVADFHAENRDRAQAWPNALTTSATHDTKRGEDARSRLIALSETPDLWAQALAVWKAEVGPLDEPDANDQYFLLQTLFGVWPVELLVTDDAEALAALRERLSQFVPKALREAKRHTKWIEPNEGYEKATIGLLDRLLTDGSHFVAAMRPLAQDLARRGMLVSLARTVLKCTVPGAPDFYQGTALFDFSLVDPDNRRPVDYRERATVLDRQTSLADLLAHWQDGAVKLRLTTDLLQDRQDHAAFYAEADYEPLTVTGEHWTRVVAFVRRRGDEALAVVVPRHSGAQSGRAVLPIGDDYWNGTSVELPHGTWRSIFDDRRHEARGLSSLAALFGDLPFSVLRLAA